ncbi:hypothetical protein A5722_17125 [Mycobacterium vulneris]|nr:hypothetical protein A5722_17125 [Mycolicibacterium vulneris]OCB65596.1 hypothetical protein A5729_15960 [Mycolicibacterium vulneris]
MTQLFLISLEQCEVSRFQIAKSAQMIEGGSPARGSNSQVKLRPGLTLLPVASTFHAYAEDLEDISAD